MMAQYLETIEKERGTRLLVLAVSNLDIDLLPPLYDALRQMGRVGHLDVLFYCRGGAPNAARRIALLLREFAGRLSFIVPDRCESSGTIAVLAADEILAGPAAVFSPVDPLLQAEAMSAGDGPHSISAQDVLLFGQMSRDWFGLEEADANHAAMSVLCDSIFPTTITSFYRSTLEVKSICLELLSLHMREEAETRSAIVDRLLFGHHSHSFALSSDDLRALGLPVHRPGNIEDLAWKIGRHLRGTMGGGVRASEEEDWFDAIIASREDWKRRRRSIDRLEGRWEAAEIE